MRTNIEIDDKLMREAMRATGAKTKRDAVEKALRKLVALKMHEKEVGKIFRRQEKTRQEAEREGRLDEWRRELERKGNWPEFPSDENQYRD
jgi:Arc/MetJ family transcription regulator